MEVQQERVVAGLPYGGRETRGLSGRSGSGIARPSLPIAVAEVYKTDRKHIPCHLSTRGEQRLRYCTFPPWVQKGRPYGHIYLSSTGLSLDARPCAKTARPVVAVDMKPSTASPYRNQACRWPERFDWRTSMLIHGARQQNVMLVSRMPGRPLHHARCWKLRRRSIRIDLGRLCNTPGAPAIIKTIPGPQSGCRKRQSEERWNWSKWNLLAN